PSDHEDVHQRDFEKEQPAQAHELIETKPREGPTNPHENKNDDRHFREEERDVDQPENPTMRAVGNSRKMPAAEEEGHHQSRAGNHRGVFAEEKESELHPGVFGVIRAGEILFGLEQLELEPDGS